MSAFEGQYKNTSKTFEKQLERRELLLQKQKLKRELQIDSHRQILLSLRQFQGSKNNHSKHRSLFFQNRLQLSEWMYEKPEQLEDWLMVPCPQGTRCLLIAENGRTEAVAKNGSLLKVFRSALPGGLRQQHRDLTIIDAIFDKKNDCFWALDLLAYANQNLIDCECSFRFFWVQSKIVEDKLDQRSKENTFPIRSLPRIPYDLYEESLCKESLFEETQPPLDGLLFYHKESHYVHGSTPLVLWLFPFMLNDVIGIRSMNPKYLESKPKDYCDPKSYIEDFNVKERQRREKRVSRKQAEAVGHEMDIEEETSKNVESEMFLLETES